MKIYGLFNKKYKIVSLKQEMNDTNIFCQRDKLPNLVYLSGYKYKFSLRQNGRFLLITPCCDHFSNAYLAWKKEKNACSL